MIRLDLGLVGNRAAGRPPSGELKRGSNVAPPAPTIVLRPFVALWEAEEGSVATLEGRAGAFPNSHGRSGPHADRTP